MAEEYFFEMENIEDFAGGVRIVLSHLSSSQMKKYQNKKQ